MSEFYNGQRVVRVSSPDANALRVGQTYTITGIYNACNCGTCVTVGIRGVHDIEDIGMRVFCPTCRTICPVVTDEWEFQSRRFRPIDSLTEQMDRIEEEGAPLELEPEYA